MVNQDVAHVTDFPEALICCHLGKGVLLEAYSPTVHGELFKNEQMNNMM